MTVAAARIGQQSHSADFFSLFPREEWMSRGRCTDADVDPEDWFPEHGKTLTKTPAIRRALALCAACPVHYACLDYAMTHEGVPRRLSGIWGGTTEGQRRRALHDEGAA